MAWVGLLIRARLPALNQTLPNGQYMIPSAPGVATTGNCTTPGQAVTASPVLETIPSTSTYKEDQFNTNLDIKLNDANRFFAKYFKSLNRENQAIYNQFGDGNATRRRDGRPRKTSRSACLPSVYRP